MDLAETITKGVLEPPKQHDVASVPRGSEPGLPYRPRSRCTPVHHLPIIKACTDQLGLVGLINHYVAMEMDVDVGTVVLGLVLDTLSGCIHSTAWKNSSPSKTRSTS